MGGYYPRYLATKRISATVTPVCTELIKRLHKNQFTSTSRLVEDAITEYAEKRDIKISEKQKKKLLAGSGE